MSQITSLDEILNSDSLLVGQAKIDTNFETIRLANNDNDTRIAALEASGTEIYDAIPATVASNSGVVTLANTTRSFIVTGIENITSITGVTAGTFTLRWASSRTIEHNAVSLILRGGGNRTVSAGDYSKFEMTAAGAREVDYFNVQTSATTNNLAKFDSNKNPVDAGVKVDDSASASTSVLWTSNKINTALSGIQKDIYVPYSVNSGTTDANGYADFINKVSNTEISFDVPFTLTFPNGNIYTLTTVNNVTGISSDGTYYVVIEEADITGGNTVTPKVTTSAITEGIINGSGGSDGAYNLNYGRIPYYPEKRASGSWAEKQFVKIGEFTRTGGTLGTPVSYGFNGKYFVNGGSLASSGTVTSFNCNIGSRHIPYIEVICVSAAGGYSVGDRVGGLVNSYDDTADTASPILVSTNNTIKIAVAEFVIIPTLSAPSTRYSITGDSSFNILIYTKRIF